MKKLSENVVSITSEIMGSGSDELGLLLMQAFINTLTKQDELPKTIIFYNAGVKLCANDSPVIETLKSLENSGVKLLSCGTCLDYYDLKESLGVGIISNMHDIQSTLFSATRIITP
jgi:selenium metabolism protein YedF